MKLERIIEYGIYLFVFLLPLQTRWIIKAGVINEGYWEYGTYSLYVTDVILLAVLFLFFIYKYKVQSAKCKVTIQNVKLYNSLYLWLFIALLDLAAFISIFFALDKMLAVYVYARLLLGIGLFWLVSSATYQRMKLLFSFLAGIFLQAILGIGQFLTQSSFVSKWLGIAMHSSVDLGISVVETLNGERWLRAYGGLDHPNMLGGLICIGLLLIIGKFQNPNFKIQISNNKILKFFTFYFLLFTFISALFFTFSRAAWLGLVAGVLAIIIIILAREDLVVKRELAKIIFYSAFFIFILFNIFRPLVGVRLASEGRLEEKSKDERLAYFQETKNIIKESWLTGVGIGNYTLSDYYTKVGREPAGNASNNMPSWFFQPVHNAYLLIWAETGLIGFLGFLGCLGFLGWAAIKKRNLVALPILFSLIIMMFFDHWCWSLHFGTMFLWFMLGWLHKENSSIII